MRTGEGLLALWMGVPGGVRAPGQLCERLRRSLRAEGAPLGNASPRSLALQTPWRGAGQRPHGCSRTASPPPAQAWPGTFK